MIPESVEIFMKVVIAIVCIAVLLPIVLFVIKRFFKQDQTAHRAKYIQEANAIVLAVELTGLYLKQQAQVKLQVQVLPDKGRNFVAEVKAVFDVTTLNNIHMGTAMRVKYNPANTKEITLVEAG